MNLFKIFKLIIIFLTISLVSLLILFSILALIFLLFNVPFNLIHKLALVCAAIGVFLSSFFVSQLTENNDVVLSLICGLILAMIIVVITSFTTADFFNLKFYIKTSLVVLSSFLGGILAKLLKS